MNGVSTAASSGHIDSLHDARGERLARLLQWLPANWTGLTAERSSAGPNFGQLLAARTAELRGGRERPKPTEVDELIRQSAQRYGMDEGLVRAVVQAESGFNPQAVSAAGAKGLMQLMDATARALGVDDPFDAAQNVDGGVRYLRSLLDRFDSLPLALAAYNAGPGAVQRYGGVPPYAETRTYVNRVLSSWQA